MIKFANQDAQEQLFKVLIARQAGNEFYKSVKPTGEYKGQDVHAVVGTMEPGQEITVRLFTGEDVTIAPDGLTVNLALTLSDIEALNRAPGNAYIIAGKGMVNMNSNGGHQFEGNLWITPSLPQEFNVMAAPPRTRAQSKDELEASLSRGADRSLAARLQKSSENAAKREQERLTRMEQDQVAKTEGEKQLVAAGNTGSSEEPKKVEAELVQD